MTERNTPAARILESAGLTRERVFDAVQGMRGGQRVTDPQAETRFRALEKYSRDLTQLAREGKLDPVIGRDTEILRLIQILSRRTKNNPVLIGEAGVGKTAIVEGLAQKIASNDIPEILSGKRVVALDLGSMIAGSRFRGEFEERLKAVMDEVQRARGEIIMMIDELHTVVGAGAAQGAMDASPTCSSLPWRAANCNASARPRWMNSTNTSRRMPRSSAASLPFTWRSRAWTIPSRCCWDCATATKRTTKSTSRRKPSKPPPVWRTATSPTVTCPTRRLT